MVHVTTTTNVAWCLVGPKASTNILTREAGNGIRYPKSGIILCMRPTNERRRYIVTSSLIGWAHTQNDPCPFPVGCHSRSELLFCLRVSHILPTVVPVGRIRLNLNFIVSWPVHVRHPRRNDMMSKCKQINQNIASKILEQGRNFGDQQAELNPRFSYYFQLSEA